MKSFVIERYSKEKPMRLVELPEPRLKDHDVLIQVHAAGVNLLDSKIKTGEFKLLLPYSFPLVLGHDVAGIVAKVGSRVQQFKVGDEVYARPRDGRIGTFAELIAVDESDLALKPKSLTMTEAASIPLVGLTAWQALVEKAGLKKGHKVFIQAGSGGVGTFAIQLAKHFGATVATTASAANAELVKRLGADTVIDYRTQDFESALSGQDVVLHSQDKTALFKSFNVLKSGGKLISISGPPDPRFAQEQKSSFLLRQLFRLLSSKARKTARRRGVDYAFLFMRANGPQLREIAALIDAGSIRPVLDRVFPFTAANEALAHVESGRAKGKVVINMRQP